MREREERDSEKRDKKMKESEGVKKDGERVLLSPCLADWLQ